jgi:hypothetical protein
MKNSSARAQTSFTFTATIFESKQVLLRGSTHQSTSDRLTRCEGSATELILREKKSGTRMSARTSDQQTSDALRLPLTNAMADKGTGRRGSLLDECVPCGFAPCSSLY